MAKYVMKDGKRVLASATRNGRQSTNNIEAIDAAQSRANAANKPKAVTDQAVKEPAPVAVKKEVKS